MKEDPTPRSPTQLALLPEPTTAVALSAAEEHDLATALATLLRQAARRGVPTADGGRDEREDHA